MGTRSAPVEDLRSERFRNRGLMFRCSDSDLFGLVLSPCFSGFSVAFWLRFCSFVKRLLRCRRCNRLFRLLSSLCSIVCLNVRKACLGMHRDDIDLLLIYLRLYGELLLDVSLALLCFVCIYLEE